MSCGPLADLRVVAAGRRAKLIQYLAKDHPCTAQQESLVIRQRPPVECRRVRDLVTASFEEQARRGEIAARRHRRLSAIVPNGVDARLSRNGTNGVIVTVRRRWI